MRDIATRVKNRVMSVLHNSRGFTLIELLIVLAIIAIIAGIAIPRYTASLQKAKESACAANIAVLESAAMRYWADNDFKYPEDGTLTVQMLKDGGYLKEVTKCPVNNGDYTITVTGGNLVGVTCGH